MPTFPQEAQTRHAMAIVGGKARQVWLSCDPACPVEAEDRGMATTVNWKGHRRRHHENHDCCRGLYPKPRLCDQLSICRPRGEHGYWHAYWAGGLRSCGG